jgi:hypothetical protein
MGDVIFKIFCCDEAKVYASLSLKIFNPQSKIFNSLPYQRNHPF